MLAVLDDERDRIFGEWLAAHSGALFKVVHAHASTQADRDDLFQEIVVQVWRSVDSFRSESSVITWIYRVALNTAIAWNQRKARHQRREQPLEAAAGVLSRSSPDNPDPRVEWLYRQLAELAEVERAIALLMLDGFSYREIADVVGISENYVGVKINRIKSWLSARLAKEQDDEPR
jgi:RNA polymerase sigma-70 factor, ECF subfamily